MEKTIELLFLFLFLFYYFILFEWFGVCFVLSLPMNINIYIHVM